MTAALPPELSKKFRFYAFISMVLLVYVHGYNLHNRYLQPFTVVDEPMTFNAWFQYFMTNGILRFRIPLLFVISGYLFAFYDNAPHKERVWKRVKTLLLPYFLWSVIGLLIAVALYYWSWTTTAVSSAHLQPVNKPFEQYSFSDWLQAILWPTSYQLWFLRCLFVYNLIYPWIKKGLRKRPWILLTFFGFLWVSSFGVVILEGEGLFFFSMGVWLCKKDKNVLEKPRWLSAPVYAILFILLSAIKTVIAFKGLAVLGGFRTTTALILLHKGVVFLGLLVVWYGMDKWVRFAMQRQWFVQLTAYAFIIYALHVPLVTYLIDPVFGAIGHWPQYRLITFLLLPLCIIAFCISVGYLLRQLTPKVYAVVTGNRGLKTIK